MTDLTFGRIFAAASATPNVQRRNLCELVLAITDMPTDTTPAEFWHALAIWTADLLFSVRLCPQASVLLLITRWRPVFQNYGQCLATYLQSTDAATKLQMQQIAICDRRYATATGDNRIIDLQTGETVEKLPSHPLETVGYDLGVLFMRRYQQLTRARASNETTGSEKDLD